MRAWILASVAAGFGILITWLGFLAFSSEPDTSAIESLESSTFTERPGLSREDHVRTEFKVWYRALSNFISVENRFPTGSPLNPSSEIRVATGIDADQARPPKADAKETDMYGDSHYVMTFRLDRVNGTEKPTKPQPNERDVWMHYEFRDVRSVENRKTMLLWSDGVIELRSNRQMRYIQVPILPRTGMDSSPQYMVRRFWPEESGVPEKGTYSLEEIQKEPWLSAGSSKREGNGKGEKKIID